MIRIAQLTSVAQEERPLLPAQGLGQIRPSRPALLPGLLAAVLLLVLVQRHAEELLPRSPEVLGAAVVEDVARDLRQDVGHEGPDALADEVVRVLDDGVVEVQRRVLRRRVPLLDVLNDDLGVHEGGAVLGEADGGEGEGAWLVGLRREAEGLEEGGDVGVLDPLGLVVDALVVEREAGCGGQRWFAEGRPDSLFQGLRDQQALPWSLLGRS